MIPRLLAIVVLSATASVAQDATPAPSPAVAPTASPTPAASPTPTPTPVPTPTPTLRERVNSLKDEEVAKAVTAVREKFLDDARTSEAALQRATLEGILRRFGPGATLIDTANRPPVPEGGPFLAEILDSHIGYVRLGSLEPNVVPQLDAALMGFTTNKVDAVVLDLREVPPGENFEVAADVARRLAPKGKLLFSIQKPSAKQERIYTSNQDPAFQGVIVVLVDGDNRGAAEALAATLRQNAGAMIIGADTIGGAAEFTEVPLSDKLAVRIAVAQVLIPDAEPIFPGGVKPDVSITLPRDVQAQIFRESKEKGVSQFVFENERRRMNEAALLSGQNPEIDSAQSMQRERGRSAPLRDTVLQRAVDLVTAINFYQTKTKK